MISKQRIIIDLFDHTPQSEVADILAELKRIGLDHARYDGTPPKTAIELTPDSLELFLGLAEDAPNWSGSPLVTVTPAQRGNLTHLKKLGLIETFEDEGCSFATFTDTGVELAVEHGFDAENLKFGL